MKKALGALLSGLAVSAVAVGIYRAYRSGRFASLGRAVDSLRLVDLNRCTMDQLTQLPGLRPDIVDRIIDNRPYRNKLDLVSRMIVPQFEYEQISHLVVVKDAEAPVKVA